MDPSLRQCQSISLIMDMMYKIDKKELSKIIESSRFILILGVVFVHAGVHTITTNNAVWDFDAYPVYTNLSYFLSRMFGLVCVPLFFFFSGFLYFYRPGFSKKVYWNKTKSRVKSLLIPYILWNLLVLAILFLSQTIFPEMMSGQTKIVTSYGFSDCVSIFTVPLANQFWYIRNLMVISVLSPVVYCVVVKMGGARIVALLFFVYVLGSTVLCSEYTLRTVFFFTLGAYMGITDSAIIYSVKYLIIGIVGLCCVAIAAKYTDAGYFFDLTWRFYKCLGAYVFLSFMDYLLKTKRITGEMLSKYAKYVFFIYALHMTVIVAVEKPICVLFSPGTDYAVTALYLLAILMSVALPIIIAYLMSLYLPKLYLVLTGMRQK